MLNVSYVAHSGLCNARLVERSDPSVNAPHPIVTNFACVSLRNRMAHAQRRTLSTLSFISFMSHIAQVAVVHWNHSALDAWLEKVGLRRVAASFDLNSASLAHLVPAPTLHNVTLPAAYLLPSQEMSESSSETMFYVFGGTEPQVISQINSTHALSSLFILSNSLSLVFRCSRSTS
jgi:hypothetical protein